MAAVDYVIIGAGSAGCVMAARLSEDPNVHVALLEAGGPDDRREIHIPAAFSKLFKSDLDWNYATEPQEHLHGRSLYWPRGKVLGGTSSINGMTFVRGQAAYYDSWAALTGDAWSWRTVLPYFKRIEDSPFGTRELRGTGGPMRIGGVLNRHPLAEAFLQSSVAAGVVHNDDYNGATQEGISFTQVMMRDGVRSSAESAYLAPVRGRANLRVLTRSLARRIVVEDGRAVAVEFESDRGVQRILARREVLLCGGTIASPQMLLLSGIGDSRALNALGISLVCNLPAVGRNLQEHLRVQLVYRTNVPSFNREARGVRLLGHVARYVLRKRGLLAVTASQVNGFVRSSPEVDRPDLQLVFRPSSGNYAEGRYVVHDYQGVMAMVGLLRPKSRGHVALRSADPHAAPGIVAGHLTDPADYDPLIRGVGLMRRIFARRPLRDYVLDEVRPGKAVDDDASLRNYIRSTADSLFHAVGTCAMGASADSVTTPELRVRGVEGLRVVDASVMPLVPSGNTAAAVLMIAERASDLILGQGIIPKSQSVEAMP